MSDCHNVSCLLLIRTRQDKVFNYTLNFLYFEISISIFKCRATIKGRNLKNQNQISVGGAY